MAQSVKGGCEEEVDDQVVALLRKAESEKVKRVDVSGFQLRILTEAFLKIHGLIEVGVFCRFQFMLINLLHLHLLPVTNRSQRRNISDLPAPLRPPLSP